MLRNAAMVPGITELNEVINIGACREVYLGDFGRPTQNGELFRCNVSEENFFQNDTQQAIIDVDTAQPRIAGRFGYLKAKAVTRAGLMIE